MGCFARQVSNQIAPVADLMDTYQIGHQRLAIRGSALAANSSLSSSEGLAPRRRLPGAGLKSVKIDATPKEFSGAGIENGRKRCRPNF
jgi:hypothetical protein